MEQTEPVKKAFYGRSPTQLRVNIVAGSCFVAALVLMCVNLLDEIRLIAAGRGSGLSLLVILETVIGSVIVFFAFRFMILTWRRVRIELMESGDLRVIDWHGVPSTYTTVELSWAKVYLGAKTPMFVRFYVEAGRRRFCIHSTISDFQELMAYILATVPNASPGVTAAVAKLRA